MEDQQGRKRPRIRIPRKKKIALVCSGGAAKAGAFHLGVALALQEKGFKFVGGLKRDTPDDSLEMVDSSGRDVSIYVASSAGSIICSYLAAGYKLDQIFDSFLGKAGGTQPRALKRLTYTTMFSLRKDAGFLAALNTLSGGIRPPALGRFVQALAKDSYENIFKWKWLKWSGLFSTAGIEKYLREDVLPSNDFQSYEPDLFIVATQLNHSRKVVFGKYRYSPPNGDQTVVYMNETNISDACAASTALPLVFSPYPIKNEKGKILYYFDGEIRDTLSTHVGYDAGADLIIASYTHQPYHFSSEIGSLHEYGMPAIMIQAIYLMIERKIQSAVNQIQRDKAVLDSVSRFFKENNLPEKQRQDVLDMLERKLGHKRNVDYVYIHPKSADHSMFFGDHFNLSGSKMSEIVRLGFRCAIESLRRYEFE